MAEYSPEWLAYAQHGIEQTDKTMDEIAVELGVGKRTLYRQAKQRGWKLRGDRPRALPEVTRLREDAMALAAKRDAAPPRSPPPPESPVGWVEPLRNPSPGRPEELMGFADAQPIQPPPPSALERIERLLHQQLADAEAERAALAVKPRSRVAAERAARTLATLTHTARLLAALRGETADAAWTDDDDMPRDIDAFRLDLARRIDAFVASRSDAADAGGNAEPAPLGEVP